MNIGHLAYFLLVVFSFFAVQNMLGYFLQIRQYQKTVKTWLGKGILSMGQRRGLFTPGEILILIYNPEDDLVISVQSMRGLSVFAHFREKPEYRSLSLEELRQRGIVEDRRDLRFWRLLFSYEPGTPTRWKGALIQAVEGVEDHLRNRAKMAAAAHQADLQHPAPQTQDHSMEEGNAG
ncbi:MAG: transcriptional regulator GutM [Treponema sp.]|nr:transcriptional regulator GutM [Treponema sp.]